MKYLSLLVAILTGVVVSAQSVLYKLGMSKPQTHYFEVEMILTDFKTETLDLKMPVWAPGSYLVREFPSNVNLVKAYDEKGNALQINKTDKNTWKVEAGKAKKVRVNYEVYAFDLTVRTSFLDLTHGYINGTSVFMYVDGFKELPGDLIITPHYSFKKVTTALPKRSEQVAADGTFLYRFDTFDQLVDCPIEIGNQIEFSFTAAGIPHHVAIYGEGNYNIERLKHDMAKIVESTTNIFGFNPNDEYWFIIHNTTNGGGGLEHTNSTTLNVRRWSYEGSSYLGFLSLVAHEYFHLWNVKRLRPIELGPFDYDKENYTSLLWVMEGFTSYYDELILRRAGFYSEDEYLNKLFATLNAVENQPGNKIQPVAHASFDAWIKAYRPNENSYNTTISYYSKGQLIGLVCDAMIIDATNGKKSLDDFMQVMYDKYYVKAKRGFTEDEFKKEMEAIVGKKLDQFFEDYIHGTKTIDYNKYLSMVGLRVTNNGTPEPFFGTSLSEDNGKLMVKRVQSGSAAEAAGVSANDEILAVNGFRASQKGFSDYLGSLMMGDAFKLLVSRDDVLMELDAYMGEIIRAQYRPALIDEAKKEKLLRYWLREK
ncbi:PDZ domain-containing protein [Wandonia haliotis]|uniref:PDZ domain-containing protein n=1 Tax=Wandonia haliotis TaxID=574963 RepID=A0ABP3Y0Z4_9FLAO